MAVNGFWLCCCWCCGFSFSTCLFLSLSSKLSFGHLRQPPRSAPRALRQPIVPGNATNNDRNHKNVPTSFLAHTCLLQWKSQTKAHTSCKVKISMFIFPRHNQQRMQNRCPLFVRLSSVSLCSLSGIWVQQYQNAAATTQVRKSAK